jgi:REP element-mobilizing transposase RayT
MVRNASHTDSFGVRLRLVVPRYDRGHAHAARSLFLRRSLLGFMTRPLRLEYPGAFWHVHNRGVEQRDIVLEDDDRRLWLDLLAAAIGEVRWIAHAYVLMTNHFHLLIETPQTTLSSGVQTLEGQTLSSAVSLSIRCPSNRPSKRHTR